MNQFHFMAGFAAVIAFMLAFVAVDAMLHDRNLIASAAMYGMAACIAILIFAIQRSGKP